MGTRPDIVMLMTDQHAARILGCAGDPHAVTPALDRLAAQGTRFETCYCASPLCVPSRMAFLTGLEPHRSGVLNNDTYLPSDIPTIAHALGAAGYDCHLVGRMHFYGPDQTHGFASRPIGDIGASFPGAPPPDIGPLTGGRGNRGPEIALSGAGETSYQAYDHAVVDEAERTLRRLCAERDRTGRPFFLLVSLFCPHPPYIARREDLAPFEHALPPPRLPVPAPSGEHPAIAAWRRAGRVDTVTPEATATARAAYYGLVRMVDRLCGRVLDLVGSRADTVTIYTSDHGESLGERGLWWKSTMYDESAKVPLIVRAPGMGAGVVDARVVSLMDLSATILRWGGAGPLPGHAGRDLRCAAPWDDTCVSAYYGGLMNISMPDVRHRMIRRGRYKLMWFDGHRPMLFDLSEDPDECRDLFDDPDHGDALAELSQAVLQGWDPGRIARLQATQRARIGVIRDWVAATRPPEPWRWVDENKARNRHE
jgi:choline-sulfatase